MVLELENVSLIRDGNWILQDINWQINKGENWVLFGLNGSGKTAMQIGFSKFQSKNGYFPFCRKIKGI